MSFLRELEMQERPINDERKCQEGKGNKTRTTDEIANHDNAKHDNSGQNRLSCDGFLMLTEHYKADFQI